MSALRASFVAAAVGLLAGPAFAQTGPAADRPQATLGLPPSDPMQPIRDREIIAHVIANQLEGRSNGTNTEFRWSGQGWIGTDYDKLWIKSEGTLQSSGALGDGRHEFLYDRAITTYFNLQGGLRTDLDSSATRNWAAFGLQGLAPYFFDLELTFYASDQGHLAGLLEASYDLLITQRLILQPQVELNLYSRSDPARRVGSGFSEIDTGLRLRYEITRQFAPYLGVVYEGKFGNTATFARQAGESTSDVRVVFGLRAWF